MSEPYTTYADIFRRQFDVVASTKGLAVSFDDPRIQAVVAYYSPGGKGAARLDLAFEASAKVDGKTLVLWGGDINGQFSSEVKEALLTVMGTVTF